MIGNENKTRVENRENTLSNDLKKAKIDTHIKSKENKNSRNYMYTNFLLDKRQEKAVIEPITVFIRNRDWAMNVLLVKYIE